MSSEHTACNLSRKKTLKVCSWNIHGYKSRQIGIKLIGQEFLNIMEDVDLLGLTETHIHEETLEDLNIPGFIRMGFKNNEKNIKSGTAPGGIAVFVKEHIEQFFSVIKTENQDCIWLKLKKDLSGEENDIYIGTYYISPSKGKDYLDKNQNLSEDIMYFQRGQVIINGEFKSKTSNEIDYIIPDKYDHCFVTNYTENMRKRNSQDKSIDERGKAILEMCRGLDLTIINGRRTGDIFGKFTCFQWNGNSVVDYVITSGQISQKIPNFWVGEFIPWLLDHCPLNFSLELKNTEMNRPNISNRMEDAPAHFIWSNKSMTDFTNHLNTVDCI